MEKEFDWKETYRVDEVIECLPLGPNHDAITRELLNAMPNAYDGPVPGEDDSPWEIDHPNRTDYGLDKVWHKLSQETQATIENAYREAYREMRGKYPEDDSN